MTSEPNHSAKPLDLSFVDLSLDKLGTGRESLIELLQTIQEHYGYLPQAALERICRKSEISPADITGVATFYDQFRLDPVGRHRIQVCIGTACHVKGAESVYQGFRRHLKIAPDRDTDEAGLFTVDKVACLGCCTLAPAVQIGNLTYGHVTADSASEVVDDYLGYLAKKPLSSTGRKGTGSLVKAKPAEIRVCLDSCCVARGCDRVAQAVARAIMETAIPARLKPVGCVGICDQTPLLEIFRPGRPSISYARVEPGEVKTILLRHFRITSLTRRVGHGLSTILDWLVCDRETINSNRQPLKPDDRQVSGFLKAQYPITTQNCSAEDPVDIEAYLRNRGFAALRHCLEQLTPNQVIELTTTSQLRGRGGAGYGTGLKWQKVASAEAKVKYLICNGDEGDPGAFMDRMLLESCPYRIIEGMAIAAYAVGAEHGYFYIRSEYPTALRRVASALAVCRRHNLLGERIMKHDFSLELEIRTGAGAFVCGEETALIAALEGARGMPRIRPPYPARQGLRNQPTLVNNVETFANLPWIVQHGPPAFTALGTGRSKGTKVFSLAGKIANGALIEVPMGISLREIIEKVGGGVADGRKLKAVQVGGPSGGCIPAGLINTRVDYEDLTEAGAIMGSGGMVVLDEDDCMVDLARYFLQFTQSQSCGKCTFCRIGTRRMLDILERLCLGHGRSGDIEKLEELGLLITRGSLCGLGKTAPNPVISTITYFRDEYQAHINGKCPAGTCRALIAYSVNDNCIGCTICAQHCPVEAIEIQPFGKAEINPGKCIRCAGCRANCPSHAIEAGTNDQAQDR